MKILLIANYLPDAQKSMQSFSDMLCTGLTSLGYDVRTVRPEPFFGKLKPSATGFGKWLGYMDKFILFPHRLRKAEQWADIVHICDHSNAFYTRYLKNKPHFVTCHDLLAIRSALGEFPENPTRWTGKILQWIILRGLNRSKRVICDSEATKKDLMRIGVIAPERISVIYPGFNHPYSPMEKSECRSRLKSICLNLEAPFILHVGGNQWYKNRLGVLNIFKKLIRLKDFSSFNLIMVGKLLTPEMQQFIGEQNLEKKVFELKGLEKQSLCALYAMARALVFPSLEEGFGWPIIEAQACGAPVFTTNRPPMTEVAGNAAVYIDPDKPEEAAGVIARYLSGRGKIDEMRKKGFLNAERFKTKDMIRSYEKEYQKILQ